MSPINTSPLQQFIQQVKAAELSQQREIKVDIKAAKALVFCMSEINARLLEDFETFFIKNQNSSSVSLQLDGGGFGDK
jgi:hypothetical protein